jgi:hypothetical protein
MKDLVIMPAYLSANPSLNGDALAVDDDQNMGKLTELLHLQQQYV